MRANEAHRPREWAAARSLRQAQLLIAAILIWAVALLALGAVVAATDATEGCSGWPLCNGQAAPPSDVLGFLNSVHRIGGALLAAATAGLALLSFVRLRAHPWAVRLTATIFVLVLAQSVFGGYSVAFGFPAWATGAHLAMALLVIAGLLAGLILFRGAVTRQSAPPTDGTAMTSGYVSLAAAGSIALFLALVTGAAAGVGAESVACDSVSSCSHDILGSAGSAAGIAGLPYVLGLITAGSVGGILVAGRDREANDERFATLGATSAVAFMAGVAIALVIIIFDLPDATRAIPVTLMILAWLCLTGIVLQGGADRLTAALENPRVLSPALPVRAIARDFLRVSKPGIMLLLLTTTLGGMLIAAAGWPGTGLVVVTLLGGAMASGGASAMNCYFDRDIDRIMARTRKRPIPLGSLTAEQVRAFAVTLSILAVIVLTVFVNPLAALLALAGNLFYIIVYTVWLKRSTPQNIVIGGAAGSFPPLVGWAAVAGSITLTPLLLAAIIFYWTPPHFWSLALLKANDYRRANIPMLPVTHGDQVTRRFIFLYSLLLVAITLLVVPAGAGGIIYLAAAGLLGAWFIALAARMYREGTSRLAWRLFKFSNYYLALVLAALVVDRILTG